MLSIHRSHKSIIMIFLSGGSAALPGRWLVWADGGTRV